MTVEQIAMIAGAIVLVGGIVVYLVRQRGGEGPPVGEVPRFLRPLTNAWYGVNRWPIPFDRDGELIPIERRKRAS
jgi:hypothetical protein